MLFRFTRRVFVDLGIWMIAFGLVVGVVFPPAVCWMGVPSEYAMTFTFYAYCLTAGVAVGGANITLAQAVVKKRLRGVGRSLAPCARHPR